MTEVDLNQSGIYAITSPSGKRYVGSAVNIRKRWQLHNWHLKAGRHHCAALQHAYHKYGSALVYSIVALCSREELLLSEQRHIDRVPRGMRYNSSPTAGSTLGFQHTEETKAKTASSLMGHKQPAELVARRAANRLGKALKNNTSGFVGVVWDKKRQAWRSQVKLFQKNIFLGRHPTAEQANEARQNFDRILRYYDE